VIIKKMRLYAAAKERTIHWNLTNQITPHSQELTAVIDPGGHKTNRILTRTAIALRVVRQEPRARVVVGRSNNSSSRHDRVRLRQARQLM
jgi:hypothetical protein